MEYPDRYEGMLRFAKGKQSLEWFELWRYRSLPGFGFCIRYLKCSGNSEHRRVVSALWTLRHIQYLFCRSHSKLTVTQSRQRPLSFHRSGRTSRDFRLIPAKARFDHFRNIKTLPHDSTELSVPFILSGKFANNPISGVLCEASNFTDIESLKERLDLIPNLSIFCSLTFFRMALNIMQHYIT